MTERVCIGGFGVALSVLAALGHLSHRERQGRAVQHTHRRSPVRLCIFGLCLLGDQNSPAGGAISAGEIQGRGVQKINAFCNLCQPDPLQEHHLRP